MTTIEEYLTEQTHTTYYDMYGNLKHHYGDSPIETTTGFWYDMLGTAHEYTWDYRRFYPDITKANLKKWPTPTKKHKEHDTETPCDRIACQALAITDAVYGTEHKHYWQKYEEVRTHLYENPNTPYEAERKFKRIMSFFFKTATTLMTAIFATAILVWGAAALYTAMTDFEFPSHDVTVPVDTGTIQETIQFDCLSPLHASAQAAMEDAEEFENIHETFDTCKEIAAHYDDLIEP